MSLLAETCTDLNTTRSVRFSWRSQLLYLAGYLLMTLWALLMALVAILTFFQWHRLYLAMARGLARTGLWLGGVRLVVHQSEPFPTAQTVYICNHGSTIDVIILLALGLPNVRYFLSGHLRRMLPLALIAYLLGTFWTVPQTFTETRRAIFQRAARILKRTKQSVYLSPEGNQGNTGVIAPFNKGAFHLAIDLRAPIVPMFIYLSPEVDPGWTYEYRSGTVHVWVHPPIATHDWRLDELEQHRATIRKWFLEQNQQWHGTCNL